MNKLNLLSLFKILLELKLLIDFFLVFLIKNKNKRIIQIKN